MSGFCVGVAILLAATLAAGLLRVLKGPTPADRMLAVQLVGTTGTAIILILGQVGERPILWDVALLFALLAVVSTAAFVRRAWPAEEKEGDDGS